MIRPRLSAGSAIAWNQAGREPEPALITGNQRSMIAKTISRMIAETKGGKERPSSEAMRVT